MQSAHHDSGRFGLWHGRVAHPLGDERNGTLQLLCVWTAVRLEGNRHRLMPLEHLDYLGTQNLQSSFGPSRKT